MGDWNTILDTKIDRGRQGVKGVNGSDRFESGLIDLLAEHDLVNRSRLDHPGQDMWSWQGVSPSGQVWSYLDRETSLLVPRLLDRVSL